MATTRIIPMHQRKKGTIAESLKHRIDYAKNPDKTDSGKLVSAYECEPEIVDSQFLFAKSEYRRITGREQKSNVIAYQVRQSFKPGEISPEEANRLGYEFAMRFLKGKHAFIVATHIDRKHIHNHVIWNSTSLDCTRKFRNFWNNAKAVRELSDSICIENGLSFIETEKGKRMPYRKWQGKDAKPTHRESICSAIDKVLDQKPDSLSMFFSLLNDAGVESKQRGNTISLRGEGQTRFKRMDTLGVGYDLHELQAVITGDQKHQPKKPDKVMEYDKSIQLLVDIQAALAAGKNAGYERWAKVFNLKQMAKTVNFLTRNEMTEYDLLVRNTDEAKSKFDALTMEIKRETPFRDINFAQAYRKLLQDQGCLCLVPHEWLFKKVPGRT